MNLNYLSRGETKDPVPKPLLFKRIKERLIKFFPTTKYIKFFLREKENIVKRNKDLTDHIRKKRRCPDCGAKNSMKEGPCGGLSVNIICSKCGARFNDMGAFGIDRISL